jgi:hypothetical protein
MRPLKVMQQSAKALVIALCLRLLPYYVPASEPFVVAFWFATVVVLAASTGVVLRRLRKDKRVRRRSTLFAGLLWRTATFAFAATTVLLTLRPLGYTSDDIVFAAIQVLSPIAVYAAALRADYLHDTHPAKDFPVLATR